MTVSQPVQTPVKREYPPIADYALIGDCHTAALVSRDGSIDWYSPRRFDAPAVFCRLLDLTKGGFLRIAPSTAYQVKRAYRDSTNILDTTFSTVSGSAQLTDCMPIRQRTPTRSGYDVSTSHEILRCVTGISGSVEFQVEFKPTFDFARSTAQIVISRDGHAVTAGVKGAGLTLCCPATTLRVDPDGVVRGTMQVNPGEQCWVILSEGRTDHALRVTEITEAAAKLNATKDYWEHWSARCTYTGPYRDAVLRSALALKLLTYEPSGAMVAAPTTSLPESVGGERNWDYRFTWLRDTSLMLNAMMTVGFQEEAADFIHWMERTIGSTDHQAPQILYGITGAHRLTETTVDLDGYRASRPVRIGNAASTQVQLDIYGEVLTAAYEHYGYDGSRSRLTGHQERLSPEAWALLRALVELAADHWMDAGNGIWEVRGEPQPFLYGRLMSWAALDRGIRLAREHHLQAPLERWEEIRDRIRTAILEQGYNARVGAFTQSLGGGDALDATALMIPRMGLLTPSDPRVKSTVEQIRKQLTHQGLVYRYRSADGLAGGEGTFTMCTLWLVTALALVGRVDEARSLFEQVLGYANDVGLLSEEIDPDSRELLGNFPQGFSHLALIYAATRLDPQSSAEKPRQPRKKAA